MIKKDVWLKLFSENDTALAAAIHLCERYVTLENLESSQEFLVQKRKELYEEVDPEDIEVLFPGYLDDEKKSDYKNKTMLEILTDRLPEGLEIVSKREFSDKWKITLEYKGVTGCADLLKAYAPGQQLKYVDYLIGVAMCSMLIELGEMEKAKEWGDKINNINK